MDKYDELIAKFKAIKEELNKDNTPINPGVVNALGGAFHKDESKFKEVQHKIEGQGHSKDSAARITAAIGRKEIGQKAMTARSVAARKSDEKGGAQCDHCGNSIAAADIKPATPSGDTICDNCHDKHGIGKSDDKEDIKLAEEIEDKVLAHMKRNKKDEKAEGHDLDIDKKEHQEGIHPKMSTTWVRKSADESLMCSENGQWKLDKAEPKAKAKKPADPKDDATADPAADAGAPPAATAAPDAAKAAPVAKPIKKDEADESPYTKRNRQIQGYKNQTNDALADQRAQRKPFDYSNHVTPATPNSKIGQPSRPWVPNAPKIKY